MPAPNQAEEDAIAAGIVQDLSKTRYTCSSVTQLTGGTANFVYRGTLTQPLSSPDADNGGPAKTTVIIKHSTDFVAINKDFPLDVTRCVGLSPVFYIIFLSFLFDLLNEIQIPSFTHLF